jgi:hypothetical protein
LQKTIADVDVGLLIAPPEIVDETMKKAVSSSRM